MPTAKRILILLSVCGAITFAQTFSAPQVQYNPGYRPPLCAAGDSVWLTTNDGIIRFPGLLALPDPGRVWLNIDGYSVRDISLGGSYQTPRWLVGAQFGEYSGATYNVEEERFNDHQELNQKLFEENRRQEGTLAVWAVPRLPHFAGINGISVQLKGKTDKSDTKREFVNDDEPSERYWELQHEKSGEITVRVLKKMNRRLSFNGAWVRMRDVDTRTESEPKGPNYDNWEKTAITRHWANSLAFGTVFKMRRGLTLSAECAHKKSITVLRSAEYWSEFPVDVDSLFRGALPGSEASEASVGLGVAHTASIGNFSHFAGVSLRGIRTTHSLEGMAVDAGQLELPLGVTISLSARTQLFTTVVGSAALSRKQWTRGPVVEENVTTNLALSPVGVRVRTDQGIRIELVPLVAESSRKSIQSMISIAW